MNKNAKVLTIGFIFLFIFVLIFSISNVKSDEPAQGDTIVSRTATTDTFKTSDNKFKKIYYSGAVNMPDSNGDYQPFEDLVSMSIDGCNIVFSYDIYELQLQPVFVMDSGQQYSCGDIPNSITVNPWKNNYRGKYKYGIDFYNVSDNIKNNLKYVVLHRTSVTNLQVSDFQISGGDIIIKEKIKLSHDDILASYTIPVINRTDIVIGNLTSNFVDNSDGSWNITFDPTVEYNFNATWQSYMNATEGDICTNNASAGGIDVACDGSITDITSDSDLDASDDSRRETRASSGGGYGWHRFKSIITDIPISDITLINWSWEGHIAEDVEDAKLFLYNITSDSWKYYDSTTSESDITLSVSETDTTNFINQTNNETGLLVLAHDGDYYLYTDYVKLEITYTGDTTPPDISISSPTNNTNHSNNGLDINYSVSDANLDSCWYSNDTYAGNTTITCGTNITTVTWTDGQHNVTIWAKDSSGNENSSSVTFYIDTNGPSINIAEPQADNYANNNSMSLNYTSTDATLTVDSCWYNVYLVAPYLNAIPNTTIANCANTTFELQGGDNDYILTLFSNDTLGNENSSQVTFGIRTNVPAVSLNHPTNNQYFNNGNDTYFNFTATDADGISTCELYGNWTGTWSVNYTWVNPTNATMNFTTVNITQGDANYIYNVFCNDTLNNGAFAVSNFTFTIDTINPSSTINSITTTTGSQTISFNSTETDLNLDTCFYSIFNSSGGIDGTNENVSITCGTGTSKSATVTAYATYNLTVYAQDKAGNENSSTQSFTTTASPASQPPGGGGGPTILPGVYQTLPATNFSLTTINFQKTLDMVLAKDSVRPRKFEALITNKGSEDIEIQLVCSPIDITQNNTLENLTEQAKLDICDSVFFSETELTVSPNELAPERVEVLVYTPEDAEFNDEYFFNIYAVSVEENTEFFSKLSVQARVPIWGLIYKWSPFLGQQSVIPTTSEELEKEQAAYPVVWVSLIAGLVLSVGSVTVFTIARKKEKRLPATSLFVGLGVFFVTLALGVFLL